MNNKLRQYILFLAAHIVRYSFLIPYTNVNILFLPSFIVSKMKFLFLPAIFHKHFFLLSFDVKQNLHSWSHIPFLHLLFLHTVNSFTSNMENQGIKKRKRMHIWSSFFSDDLSYDIFYFLPWQIKSTFIIVLVLLDLPRNAMFCTGFRGFVKCVYWLTSWQNRARWSKLLWAVSSKVGSKTGFGYY